MARGKIFAMIFTVLAVLGLGAAAQADLTYTPIPFTYNDNNYGRDHNYPQGNPTLGGIPFDIPIYPSNNNVWNSIVGGAGIKTLIIPVNLAGVREVDTLINVQYGSYGWQYTTLDFYWSGGAIVHKVLTDGVDIRDWWNGSGPLTISSPTINVYTGTGFPSPHNTTWMDKQMFTFADSYGDQVLTQIVMTDTGADGVHRAFLSGVTVGAVPLPGAVWLLGSGLVGLVGLRRKFRKS